MRSLVRATAAWMVTCCWSVTAHGEVIFVRPDGSGDVPTIQAAVDIASRGDQIVLGDGVFTGSGNTNVTTFKNLVIRSQAGDPRRCVVDGQNAGVAGFYFKLVRAPSALEGISVVRMFEMSGAALVAWQSPMTVTNCEFRENVAWGSGAILSQDSSMTLSYCLIVDNVATLGPGGGLGAYKSTVSLDHCTFARNGATPIERGGAIYGFDSRIIVTNSIICGTTFGEAVGGDGPTSCTVSCCNVSGNAGGDWVGLLLGQESIRGNVNVDPQFCDSARGVFTLRQSSPCGRPHGCDGTIGALGVGCFSHGEHRLDTLDVVLGEATPNPSAGSVSLPFEVPTSAAGRYAMSVYNVRGAIVRRFESVVRGGRSHLTWDGRDEDGTRVSPGAYFLVVRRGEWAQSRRAILLANPR